MDKNVIKIKLDNLADRIKSRGVFSVKKSELGFDIINYITSDVICSVPVAKTAKKICEIYNSGKKLSYDKMRELSLLTDTYYRLTNQTYYYKHTLSTTTDLFYYEVVKSRYEVCLDQKNYLKNKIERF